MTMSTITLGKQLEGSSNKSIKKMALRALEQLSLPSAGAIVDVGGGKGDFACLMQQKWQRTIQLLDAAPAMNLPGVEPVHCDLNEDWPLEDGSVALLVSLEVIEHLENPRHFFRQVYRLLQPGGYAFISTPHNINFIARLLFLLKGQHRHFQDLSYPAHISCLLPVDLARLTREAGLKMTDVYYNYLDVLPVFATPLYLKSRHFSNSIGILVQKP